MRYRVGEGGGLAMQILYRSGAENPPDDRREISQLLVWKILEQLLALFVCGTNKPIRTSSQYHTITKLVESALYKFHLAQNLIDLHLEKRKISRRITLFKRSSFAIVPRVQREEDQVRPDCSSAPTERARPTRESGAIVLVTGGNMIGSDLRPRTADRVSVVAKG